MRPKTQKSKLSEMVGGRSGCVRNVPPDFLRSLRTDVGRYLVGIGDADGGQLGAMCLIFVEIWRWIENELENPKLKVVGKGRGKAWTSPERPHGLVSKLTDPNRVISGQHPRCRWRPSWGNVLHFGSNLEVDRK